MTLDEKFATKEERELAIANYLSLLTHPGWKLFVEVLEANIEVLRQQLEDGIEGETTEITNYMRKQLKLMREMRDTPQTQIAKLKETEVVDPVLDPFGTVDDLLKERKEAAKK